MSKTITELDYALNCAAIEIDTTNARAELDSLRAADIRAMEHCECGCLLYLDVNAPDDAQPYCPVCALEKVTAERDAAIERAVADTIEMCAVYLDSIKKARIPEPFRKCDFYGPSEDEDGWRDLSSNEKQLLIGCAAAIRARGEKVTK